MDTSWKSGEAGYCYSLVFSHGDDLVGRDPKNVASYLRLQASQAYRDGENEISARLGTAATAINEDARNNHQPDWARAILLLCPFEHAYDKDAVEL